MNHKEFLKDMIKKLPEEFQEPTKKVLNDLFSKMDKRVYRWDIFGIGEYKDRESHKRKSFFFKIGKGFRNKDGSINLKFNALPKDQCQIREEEPYDQESGKEVENNKKDDLPF